MVEAVIKATFDGIGCLTSHDWWRLTNSEVDAIRDPAQRIISRMDPLLVKTMERYLDPVLLAVALGAACWPRLQAEKYLKEMEREQQQQHPARQMPTDRQRASDGDGQEPRLSSYGSSAVFRRNPVIERFQ
jgi:hypothetical protein